MAKMKLLENNMAMFMVCEAIRCEDINDFVDIKPDEDGLYDLRISINGRELDAERFIKSLEASYINAVKERAANLIDMQYCEVLNSIYEIQETLNHHFNVFDGKYEYE